MWLTKRQAYLHEYEGDGSNVCKLIDHGWGSLTAGAPQFKQRHIGRAGAKINQLEGDRKGTNLSLLNVKGNHEMQRIEDRYKYISLPIHRLQEVRVYVEC